MHTMPIRNQNWGIEAKQHTLEWQVSAGLGWNPVYHFE
jgi:hypothetical protein